MTSRDESTAPLSGDGDSDDAFVERVFGPLRAVIAEFESGRVFADYELQGVIGRGGQGVVYRARSIHGDKLVALKIINPDCQDTARSELQLANRLEFPNLVRVYHDGECEGRLYYTMPLAERGSLKEEPNFAVQRLRAPEGRPASVDEQRRLAGFMAKIARAVAHLHQSGIVHRDLKPRNVLIDSGGEPLVIDLGLAWRVGEGECPTGLTPAYAAPEQLRGEAGGPTKHPYVADVYSLGVILFWLLTGRLPFEGEEGAELNARRCGSEPAPAPSEIENSCVPRGCDLELICRECLKKDPAERSEYYRTAAELADDLERARNGDRISLRKRSYLADAGRWCRRNPVTAGLLGYVCVLVVALAGFSLALARQQGQQLENEVCQSNRFAAAHVASTIGRHLDQAGAGARKLAESDELRDHWRNYEQDLQQKKQDPARSLQTFFERQESVNAGLRSRGAGDTTGRFTSLALLDRKGRFVAFSQKNKSVIGNCFDRRDYFLGAMRLGCAPGDRRFHVSRVFQSEIDGKWKLSVSVPFCPDGAGPVGVVSATIATDPTFGIESLRDDARTVSLLAPVDPNPPRGNDGHLKTEPVQWLVLLHTRYGDGAEPTKFPADQRPRGGVSHDYRDPVDPQERSLAGFAEVEGTELIVAVHQRHRDSVAPYQVALEGLWLWGVGAALFGGVLVLVLRRFDPRLLHRQVPTAASQP